MPKKRNARRQGSSSAPKSMVEELQENKLNQQTADQMLYSSKGQRVINRVKLSSIVPVIVVISMLIIFYFAVSVSFVIPATGLALAFLSMLALFSTKTPIGGYIFSKKILLDGQIDAFFVVYKQGLIYLSIFSVALIAYFFASFFNFIGVHFFILSNLYLYFILTVLSLFYRNRSFGLLYFRVFRWALLLTLVMFGFSYICTELNESNILVRQFDHAKTQASSNDLLLEDATDIKNFVSLYEYWYRVNAREVRFITQYEASGEDYDLWGAINWSSSKAHYVVRDDTLSKLGLEAVPEDLINVVALLKNKTYIGEQELISAIASGGKVSLGNHKETILKYSIRSKQKSSEIEFKEAWIAFANVAGESVVQSVIPVIDARFKSVRSKAYFLPPQIHPNYVASQLLEANLHNFSNLTVSSKIIIMALLSNLIQENRVYVAVIIATASFLLCYFASVQIKKYNTKFDQEFSSTNSLFFTITTFIGLLISLVTFSI